MDHGDDHPTPHHYEHDREAAYHRGDTEAYFDEQQQQHSYYHNDDEGYNRDVERHGGRRLMSDIENEYNQLYHEIESETSHGIQHHDIYKTVPLHQ